MRAFVLPGIALAVTMVAGDAYAACSSRSGVVYGDTLNSIATRCGINVERLKQQNPGLTDRTIQNGVTINTPRPQLPSARPQFRGNRGIGGPQAAPYDYRFALPSPRPRRTAEEIQQQQQEQHN